MAALFHLPFVKRVKNEICRCFAAVDYAAVDYAAVDYAAVDYVADNCPFFSSCFPKILVATEALA